MLPLHVTVNLPIFGTNSSGGSRGGGGGGGGVPWVPWNPSFEGPVALSRRTVFDSDRTLKAEMQAACLKCKSNLPTLTVRRLKA